MQRRHQGRVFWQQGVRLIVGVAGGLDQSDASEDAADVRIDGEVRTPEREEHHDPGGLLPDAGRREEPVHRGAEVHLAEEREVQTSALAMDPAENLSDPLGLLPVESADTDGTTDRVDAGGTDGVEGSEAGEQRCERPIAVRIAGVLGQDGQDEFLDGIGAADVGRSETVGESSGEPNGPLTRVHAVRIGRGVRGRNWLRRAALGTMAAR